MREIRVQAIILGKYFLPLTHTRPAHKMHSPPDLLQLEQACLVLYYCLAQTWTEKKWIGRKFLVIMFHPDFLVYLVLLLLSRERSDKFVAEPEFVLHPCDSESEIQRRDQK